MILDGGALDFGCLVVGKFWAGILFWSWYFVWGWGGLFDAGGAFVGISSRLQLFKPDEVAAYVGILEGRLARQAIER